MTKLPIISGADAVKAFGRDGWAVARRRGSHVVLTKPGKRANLSVPLHRELDPGTLRGLLRDAGMSASELLSYLEA